MKAVLHELIEAASEVKHKTQRLKSAIDAADAILNAAPQPAVADRTATNGYSVPEVAAGAAPSTPRTDAIENEASFEELAEFARQLERELAKAAR